MLATKSGRGPEELEGCEIWEELSSYKMRSSIGAAAGGASTGGATAGAGASQGCCRGGGCRGGGAVVEYCTRAGAGAEYCTGAGTAAEYCTVAEECVVGSTVPIRRWGGATGARPTEVYCTEAGAAAEYCTAAEEYAVGPHYSSVGGAELQGLGPDAPVPSRTLNPGPPGPPPHLAQLTAVWHTLSAATQAELGHVSPDQVAEGLELARFRDLALADEEHRRALDPLLQRARLVSVQKLAVDDEIAALHRAHAERVAALTGNVYEPRSPDSPRTSAPPASLRQHDLEPTTTATSIAHRALPLPTAAAAVTSAAAPVAAPAAAVPPAPLRSEHSANVPPNTATSVATRTTFAAAPVAAPAATVTDAAAAMPPPTTTTPWTVVAARPRRQPHTSSSSAAPTSDDSYLDLRVSRLMFENYRFPIHTRIPIKELATAVDRALTDPLGRKPRLRDAHRMATKEDTPFCVRIVDDILRLVDLVRGCYETPDGARWVRNTLRDAAR